MLVRLVVMMMLRCGVMANLFDWRVIFTHVFPLNDPNRTKARPVEAGSVC